MASGDSLFIFDPLSNRPPSSAYASGDLRNDFVVLDFDDAVNESAQFYTTLPSHYVGGSLLAFVTWTSTTATSGNAILHMEATLLESGDNLDSLPAVDASDDLTLSAPATAGQLVMSQSSSLGVSGAAAGDLILIGITRLATDVSDTLAGDAEIVSSRP